MSGETEWVECGGCAPPVGMTARQADQKLADEVRASRAASCASEADLARWVAHLEAFIGPSALPVLRQSFAAGTRPGGATE